MGKLCDDSKLFHCDSELVRKEIHIFVYGLLKSTHKNDASHFVAQQCEFISKGFFQGFLFDLGHYPGAVQDLSSPLKVHGEVYKVLGNSAELFMYLDDFEGVGEAFPIPNEYRREELLVETSAGEILSQTYVYNKDWESFRIIEAGVY